MLRKCMGFILPLAVATATLLPACGGKKVDNEGASAGKNVAVEEESSVAEVKSEFVPEIVGTYEAEDGTFQGNVKSGSSRSGYSGTGYATGFNKAEEDTCTFSIDISDTGFYDLDFTGAADDHKENKVYVDGAYMGVVVYEKGGYADSYIKRVYLETGKHEVKVEAYWGYIDLDKLTVATSEPIPDDFYEVNAKLINPNADENTRRLMSYLADNYGKKVLSGQYSQDGMLGKEFTVVKKVTGKTPAIIGLDMIDYSPSRAAHDLKSNAVQSAINFWNQGGIVTFCWHWNLDEKYCTKEWWQGFSSDTTNFDIEKVMNGEDQEAYDLLMRDIDVIAGKLKELQDAGVPVIWRPLHEAGGGWFWWGEKGPEPYKKLYRLLYDKLTNEYGLNNLIWLWNGQDKDFYPGDEYVDIIGEDIYPGEKVYSSQASKYFEAAAYTDAKKMVVLSENGCVPDPDLLKRDGAMWGFWCTWGQEFVAKDIAVYSYSDQYTEADKLKEFYENDLVITEDELPDLKQYPIREELQ